MLAAFKFSIRNFLALHLRKVMLNVAKIFLFRTIHTKYIYRSFVGGLLANISTQIFIFCYILSSPLLTVQGRTSTDLMFVTDWFATIMDLAKLGKGKKMYWVYIVLIIREAVKFRLLRQSLTAISAHCRKYTFLRLSKNLF